jgi:hypothetical protein
MLKSFIQKNNTRFRSAIPAAIQWQFIDLLLVELFEEHETF